MIGLGPGARSYTRSLHYSTEYAVGQPGVRSIIENFNQRDSIRYARADYGVLLNLAEQKIRYVIKTLLRADGLDYAAYAERFTEAVIDEMPRLAELIEQGLATEIDEHLRLTEEGFAWSDTIGPWLYSEEVTARMNAYAFA